MNIKDVFKRLFSKSKTNSSDIATFCNLINIPKRDDFNNEQISNTKIDEYKDVLLNILSRDKTLTSNSLHFTDFQDEIEMNLDLLMQICFKEEWKILRDDEKKVNALVAYAKLELYLEKIIELEKEIKYNFIALEEIKKEWFKNLGIKRLINKKHTINDEENNLLGILCVLMNQKYAIYHKVNACSLEFKSYVDNDITNNHEYLMDKYNKLMEYVENLLSEDKKNFVGSFSDMVIKVAILERELEIYAYMHSDDMNDIRKRINELKKKLYNTKLKENKPVELEESIKELESKIRVFYEFGRNVASDDDIDNFYKMKFRYMVIGLYDDANSPFLKFDEKGRDDLEYSVYEKIVMDLLENLLTNKDNVLTWNFSQIDKDFLETFNNFFNYNEDKIFDVNYILTNKLILLFLIDIWDDNLYYYFHNQIIKTPSYIMDLNNAFFEVDSDIPLITFFKIMHILLNEVPDGEKKIMHSNYALDYITYFQMQSMNSLYKLFYMVKDKIREHPKKRLHDIPNGFIKLLEADFMFRNFPRSTVKFRKYYISRYISKGIMAECNNKDVYMPNSLKEIDVELLMGIEFNTLYLNEGLERVNNTHDFTLFYKESESHIPIIKAKDLVIPSSLESFPWNEIDFRYLYEIKFKKKRQSIILNDYEQIKKLIRSIVKFNRDKGIVVPKLKFILVEDDEVDNIYSHISMEKIYQKTSDCHRSLEIALIKKIEKVTPTPLISDYSELLDKYVEVLTKEFINEVYKYTDYKIGQNNNPKKMVKKKK